MSRRALGWASATLLLAALGPRDRWAATAQGQDWRQIDGGDTGPSARWDHTMAAHDAGKQLILFGGRDSGGAALGDSWSFSRASERWAILEKSGPAPRFGHAVAADQDRELLFLFGGQSADRFYNDLWQLNMADGTWTQLSDGAGDAPSPRYGTSLALDSDRRLIVTHGFTFEGRFDDTWSYDLTSGTWRDISPEPNLARPLKRCLHEAVWVDHARRMVLFGGCSSGFGPCPQGDLWLLDPPARAWNDRTLPGGPAARSNPALVYDHGRKHILLLGGLTDAGYVSDFWLLSLPADSEPEWSRVDAAGPPPRASHDAAITGPWLYLFGGNSDAGPLNDLWVLDVRDLKSA